MFNDNIRNLIEESIYKKLNFYKEKILQQGGIIDNHRTDLTQRKIQGLILLNDGNVVPAMKGTSFCTNPLQINERTGKVHLSTWSIGGMNIRWYDEHTLEDAINLAYEHAHECLCMPLLPLGCIEIAPEEWSR